MIDHDYDPYAHLMAMEQALENQAYAIENQAYAIESLGRRVREQEHHSRQQRKQNAEVLRALTSAYTLIQILEQQIKELQDEKAKSSPTN